MEEKTKRDKNNTETTGYILTGLWLVLIAIIGFFNYPSEKSLSLNEWGDFLAGATAPIAFLWLIIGYFLQRKELHLNTEALLEQEKALMKQANLMFLSATINAETSKYEVYSNFILQEKIFPDQENYRFGDMRDYLKKTEKKIDSLVEEGNLQKSNQ